jgi:hypothetical protein
MDKWYMRTLRRWLVVFVSSGIVALVQYLQANPDQGNATVFVGFIIAILTAVEKAIRDHE